MTPIRFLRCSSSLGSGVLTFNYGIAWMRECVGIYCHTAGALAKQYNPVWVSTKASDVVVHPLNRSLDIKKSEVLGGYGVEELRRVRLAKNVEPIVEGNNCDIVVVPHDISTIVCGGIALFA